MKGVQQVMNVPILPSCHRRVQLAIFPAMVVLLPVQWYVQCVYNLGSIAHIIATFLSLCSVLLDILTLMMAKLHVICALLGTCVLYLTYYQSFVTLVSFLFLDHRHAHPVPVVFLVLHRTMLLLRVKLENFPTSLTVCLVFLDFTVLILPSLHFHVLLVSIPVFMDSHLVKFVRLGINVLIQLNHQYLVHQEPSVFLEILSVWLVPNFI